MFTGMGFLVQGWLNTNSTKAGATLGVNHVGVVEYARTCGAFDLKIFRIEVHHEHALVAILKLTYAQVHTLPHT